MNCSKCGALVKTGWEFCNKCGQVVDSTSNASNAQRFENANGWIEYDAQLLRAEISAVMQMDKTMKTLGRIANLGGNQFEKIIGNAGDQGMVTVPLASITSVQAKVTKRWIWACVDACPTGSPGLLTSSGSFDEPLTAYVVFDDKEAEGKTVEIHATWFYTNPSGAGSYVSRSVTVNVKGAGASNPIPQSVAAKVTKVNLRAQFGCPWPTIGITKLKCSIRPKFTIMTDLYDQLALKDFSVAYRSKFKVQTSTNGKNWKTVQTLTYNAGSETKFVVPFNPKQPKNYLRVVSSGIPFIDSSTEFSKYAYGRTVY